MMPGFRPVTSTPPPMSTGRAGHTMDPFGLNMADPQADEQDIPPAQCRGADGAVRQFVAAAGSAVPLADGRAGRAAGLRAGSVSSVVISRTISAAAAVPSTPDAFPTPSPTTADTSTRPPRSAARSANPAASSRVGNVSNRRDTDPSPSTFRVRVAALPVALDARANSFEN